MAHFTVILLLTALAQIFGASLAWLGLKEFKEHHNKFLLVEIGIMVLISAEIMFFGVIESRLALYGIFAGLIFIFIINRFVPHKHVHTRDGEIQRLGLLVFIAMCIHELPEGVAFGSMFLLNQNVGMMTAAMIALHNIPEGTILAMPYLLKKKIKHAFSLTIVTQLLYILGGFAAYVFLISLSSTAQAVTACFAAGAMAYIAFEELNFLE